MASSWAAAPPRKVSSASVNCLVAWGAIGLATSPPPPTPTPLLNVSRPVSTRLITATRELWAVASSCWGSAFGGIPSGSVTGWLLSVPLPLQPCFGLLSPGGLGAGLHVPSLASIAGLQDLTLSIHPWLLLALLQPYCLLPNLFPSGLPLLFNHTQTLKEAAGGSLPGFCNMLLAFHLLCLHTVQDS